MLGATRKTDCGLTTAPTAVQRWMVMGMTALEYMEKQVQEHQQNFEREFKRGVPNQQLFDILEKASYYKEAVDALRKESQ